MSAQIRSSLRVVAVMTLMFITSACDSAKPLDPTDPVDPPVSREALAVLKMEMMFPSQSERSLSHLEDLEVLVNGKALPVEGDSVTFTRELGSSYTLKIQTRPGVEPFFKEINEQTLKVTTLVPGRTEYYYAKLTPLEFVVQSGPYKGQSVPVVFAPNCVILPNHWSFWSGSLCDNFAPGEEWPEIDGPWRDKYALQFPIRLSPDSSLPSGLMAEIWKGVQRDMSTLGHQELFVLGGSGHPMVRVYLKPSVGCAAWVNTTSDMVDGSWSCGEPWMFTASQSREMVNMLGLDSRCDRPSVMADMTVCPELRVRDSYPLEDVADIQMWLEMVGTPAEGNTLFDLRETYMAEVGTKD